MLITLAGGASEPVRQAAATVPMHWGALSSLAGVGVGVNLAFTVVQQFRNWLREKIAHDVAGVTVRIMSELSEVNQDGATARDEVAKVEHDFIRWTSNLEVWFVFAATGAALALLGGMAFIAMHNDDGCERGWTWLVFGASAGPLFAWWTTLGLNYTLARIRLAWLSFVNRHWIRRSKALAAKSVKATDPEAPISGSPPSGK